MISRKPIGVYPRVCGGTAISLRSKPVALGLSPRVRGNLRYGDQALAHERSIPACAGEPRAWVTPSKSAAVYPRVCGGTTHSPHYPQSDKGLSPRVRGNPGAVGPA